MGITLKNPPKDRQRMLVALAIITLREDADFSDTTLNYDEAECDTFCLADDLEAEFNITSEELEYITDEYNFED